MADSSETGTLVQRLLHVVVRLLERYAQEARVEAASDLGRLVSVIGALLLASMLSMHAVAFGHALAVVGLMALGVPALYVVLGVLAVDLVGALMCFAFARMMLSKPILPKTRAHIEDLQQAMQLLTG